MKQLSPPASSNARALLRRLLCAYAGFFALVTLSLLLNNGGTFSYTLDDPYIHLAMAENILQGHYGVNQQEFASPSSSVLWPFLLAPLQALDPWGVSPLLINFCCGLGAFFLMVRWIQHVYGPASRTTLWLSLGCLLVSNLVGLALTGMEHNLQLLLTLLAFEGLRRFVQADQLPAWLPLVLFLGPLVRYENATVSAAIGGYLVLRGRPLSVLLAGLSCVAVLGGFSLFLLSHGLDALPSSIQVKSSSVGSNPGWSTALTQLRANLSTPGAAPLVVMTSLLLVAWRSSRFAKSSRQLAAVTATAAVLHLLVGQFGWFGRYEIYIHVPLVLVCLLVFREPLQRAFAAPRRFWLGFALTAALLGPYAYFVVASPFSANDIYSQQYQMHRFATEFYRRPVAVNDLGWVSYQNPHYVLDLWGLGSKEAFVARSEEKGTAWMERLASERKVGLAMIFYQYPAWFPSVPPSWRELGRLSLKRPGVIARQTVTFFATSAQAEAELRPLLSQFALTLPDSVSFAPVSP